MRNMSSKMQLASIPFAMVAAIAAGTAFAADLDPGVRAAMKRDLGLDDARLAQYMKTERLAGQQEKTLEKQLGRSYAGSWIERQADGGYKFVVGDTSRTSRKAPAGVEFRAMRHSLSSLNASKAQLDQKLDAGAKIPQGVYGWYVDLPGNRLVVNVGAGGETAGVDFVARSAVDADSVRFETLPERPRLHARVLGGIEYTWRDPKYIHFCSTGFAVTNKDGTGKGYVTAGHCGNTSSGNVYLGSTTTTVLGSFVASNFPGTDYAVVKLRPEHTMAGAVTNYAGTEYPVRGSYAYGVGAATCRSGRTTGWRCGNIRALNATVNYGADGIVYGLTQTSACSEPGDSGGSFIVYDQAQGVLSGGGGNCTSGGWSYFQPVNPILNAYGLKLVTAP